MFLYPKSSSWASNCWLGAKVQHCCDYSWNSKTPSLSANWWWKAWNLWDLSQIFHQKASSNLSQWGKCPCSWRQSSWTSWLCWFLRCCCWWFKTVGWLCWPQVWTVWWLLHPIPPSSRNQCLLFISRQSTWRVLQRAKPDQRSFACTNFVWKIKDPVRFSKGKLELPHEWLKIAPSKGEQLWRIQRVTNSTALKGWPTHAIKGWPTLAS